MTIIKKIKLLNYKKFREYIIEPNDRINVLVGDNEAGKSTILEAIDLVSSGNIKKLEKIGFENILNINAVNEFMNSDRCFDALPCVVVELYLEGEFDYTMNGKNNTDRNISDGIRLIISPNKDFHSEIVESLSVDADYFPYDYYQARFSTFADEAYSGFKRKIKSVLIDSSNMNTDYATNDFIKRMYHQYTDNNHKERTTHKSKYQQMKTHFCTNNLVELNARVPDKKNYTFGLRNTNSSGIESELMIYEEKISINNKGAGKQSLIKTDFALERAGEYVDVILIEEPENHLSTINLRNLIQRIYNATSSQIFITTHNSFVSTRLELNNILVVSNESIERPMKLNNLQADTTKYFLKAPPAGIIEFALSQKVILVEGPSEYMLLDKFYKSVTDGRTPEQDNVHIINIRGLSFKRFLDISKLIKNKVSVITDNDSDFKKNCVDKYNEYSVYTNIKIHFCTNNDQSTFEIALFNQNNEVCNKLFNSGDALKYMLNNKTEAAYKLLISKDNIEVPQYIQEAITWIRS